MLEGTPGQTLHFRPSTKTAVTVNGNYLKGCSIDSLLTPNTAAYEQCYELSYDTQKGIVVFVPVQAGQRQKANTPWLRVQGTAASKPLSAYYLNEADAIGDANGDGKVSITDAVYVVNNVLNQPQTDFRKTAADMNGDGKITITDAVMIVNFIIGQQR